MKLTALPCLCADVFDGTEEIRPGGEELNFAVHAATFDQMDVTLMGAIGKDQYGEAILKSIADKRIHKELIRQEEQYVTANNRTYLTEEGDRYYKEDSWNGKILEDYRLGEKEYSKLSESDIVFTHYYASCFKELVELKKQYGYKLAVDFDVARNFDEIEAFCPYIDFFMISGSEEWEPVFKRFSEKYDGLFNMSLGERGSVTYFHGKEYRVAAVPVKEVVDTTGCGDSYHAGFVCSYLINGDILEAMRTGSKIASVTLSHLGGYSLGSQ